MINFDMSFKKNIKGITLIALVITIIVLLLLAGISISMFSGQDGILNKASNAKQETKKSEEYDYVVLTAQTALTEGLGKINFEDGFEEILGSEFNHLGDGLVEKDGKYYRVYENGTVTKGGVKVGDVVTYTPPSVTDAKWSAEYSGLKDRNETATDIILDNTLDITNENSFKVTEWEVLSIDDETINLVSKNPTTGTVFLGYANGYNNAVKLLDDACEELYGNEEKGIEGRSIKIEDVEGLMTSEGINKVHSYKSVAEYNKQVNNKYIEYYYYPAIYPNEKMSVINDVKNTTGLERSQQDKFYTGSMEPAGENKSIQPYLKYYTCSGSEDFENLFYHDKINYNLIIKKEGEIYHNYWMSSRAIHTGGSSCSFNICRIVNGNIGAYDIYRSTSSGETMEHSIRPVISFNAELLSRDNEGNWSVK